MLTDEEKAQLETDFVGKNGQRRTRRTMFPDPAPAPVSERMTDGRPPGAGPSGLGTPFPESFSDRIFAETGYGERCVQ